MLKILKSNKGYTLIEALICVFIGTLAIASMGYSLANGFWMADENRAHMYAYNILRDETENIRGMNYDDSELALGSASLTIPLNTHGNPVIPNATATRIVQSNPFGVGTDAKKVTIRVTWTARSGRTLTESITTYVSRVGINRG